MNYKIKISGEEYAVNVTKVIGNTAQVTVNGKEVDVEVEELYINPTRTSEQVAKPASAVAPAPVVSQAKPAETKAVAPAASSAPATEQRSPLPGTIFELNVANGATVSAGQTVLIVEAMKMENSIEAERGGVIEFKVNKGDAVAEGDVLFTIK
jgi:biotin carboxyl carrier protein